MEGVEHEIGHGMPETLPGTLVGEVIETGSIYPVPLSARHGSARDLFTIWFGGNLMVLTVSTGALTTTLFHLAVWPAVLAVILGNLAGGVLMALHAAQGPILGVPQMVQARGQFGVVGAAVITLLVVLMYLGFAASNIVLGGGTLHQLVPSLGGRWTVGLIALLCLLPALGGYRVLHLAGKLGTALGALALGLSAISFLQHPPVTVLGAASGPGFVPRFLGAFSIVALWQIAYAPYVSDYSRYLPPDSRGVRAAFWATYAGSCLGSALPMAVGLLVGIAAGAEGSLPVAMARQFGALAPWVMGAFSIGILGPTAMNIYCGALSLLSVLQTATPGRHFGMVWRMGVTVGLFALSASLALFMADSFLHSYLAFMDMLMAIMVPWTAINLVDYYLVRHGHYAVEDFFKPDGGRYGRVNGAAMGCFLLCLIVEVPFLSGHLYTGPVARMLGGADLSWIVGLLVTGPLYWFLARRVPT